MVAAAPSPPPNSFPSPRRERSSLGTTTQLDENIAPSETQTCFLGAPSNGEAVSSMKQVPQSDGHGSPRPLSRQGIETGTHTRAHAHTHTHTQLLGSPVYQLGLSGAFS